MSQQIKVKNVSRFVVDCFYGMGWENWARVEMKLDKGRRHLHVINHVVLPQEVWKEIKKELS